MDEKLEKYFEKKSQKILNAFDAFKGTVFVAKLLKQIYLAGFLAAQEKIGGEVDMLNARWGFLGIENGWWIKYSEALAAIKSVKI